jgi:hypothetical protein
MTATTLVIVAYRLLIPLSILRWPFIGAVLSIIADAVDIVIATLMLRYLHTGDVWSYHELDKYLDTYYLFIECLVAQRWPALPRWTANALFSYRVIGVVVFEVTDARCLLLVFPALFDFFFLFYAGVTQYLPQYEVTPRRLFFWLAVLLVPKLAQEYAIHYKRWLDDIVAVDIISDVTNAILDWFRRVFGAVF